MCDSIYRGQHWAPQTTLFRCSFRGWQRTVHHVPRSFVASLETGQPHAIPRVATVGTLTLRVVVAPNQAVQPPPRTYSSSAREVSP